ncbi:MAG: hypothetical protein KDA92_13480 [Planctomycetales bacterium]|nr:hypothetical protein [Planctomycetales bacterium]
MLIEPFQTEDDAVFRLLLCCVCLNLSTAAIAQNWSADDDTFDPSLHSVTIGDATWIGDPSPFVHAGSGRTGYTYVNVVNYEGMDPSVQLSLMVPLAAGETQPAAGGMLMLNQKQAEAFMAAFSRDIKAEADEPLERFPFATALKGADWALTVATTKRGRVLQLETKNEEKVDVYQFSVNASKKLLGALEHSYKKLAAQSAK